MLIYILMSANTCTISISTGANKGKLCKDVNRYCRHQPCCCDICDEKFSHKSSMERHKLHKHRVSKVQCPAASRNKTAATKSRKKINPVKKDKISELQREMAQLKENYQTLDKQLKERMTKIEQEPKNINNIIIIGDEKIFHALTKKLGSDDQAMQFLLKNTTPDKGIDIVDKLYLEGLDKDDYPIACTDGYKFRYLNRSGKIVDDSGGIKIVTKLENEIHTALIEANTKLINNYIDSNGDGLYNVYDIGDLQNKIGEYLHISDQEKFRDDLARKVYNDKHPFFC